MAMSNLAQRVLTAVVAIPLIILCVMAGGIWFFLFAAAASAAALFEFYRLAAAKGAKPQTGAGIAAGFFVNLAFFHERLRTWIAGMFDAHGIAIPFPSQSQLLMIILILAVAFLSLRELFRNDGSALLNLGATLLGICYVSLFFGTFIGLRELFTPSDPPVVLAFTGIAEGDAVYRYGGTTVMALFAMIWICDTAAFHVGSAIGRHRLFERVSPKKSWEGAIAGFIAALLTAAAARALVLDYLPLRDALVLGFIAGTFGQAGDLVESLLKRDAGVKDSSALIPGHGGAFDRFDSLLLVSPLVYLYLDFIFFR